MAQTAESIGAVTQADPNSVGAKPTEAALTEGSRVVHPAQQAPVNGETRGAPGQAPGGDGAQAPAPDDYKAWKDSLPPEQQKHIDRIVTEVRQKDVARLQELEQHTQRLAWADEVNRMVASENPQDRQRAIVLLQTTLQALEKLNPEAKPQDPLAGVDWQNLEALAPGIQKVFQGLAAQNREMVTALGRTTEVAQGTAYKAAEAELAQEAADVEAWAKQNGLPFDLDKIMETENRLNIADLRAAYYATYGEELIAAGKKTADAQLTKRKDASLPGGTAAAGAPQRPKFKSMHDTWEYLKREKGITGPIEYKG